MTIREALRELDLWGAGAVFALTDYEDSNKRTLQLIKDWKDLVNSVRTFGLNISEYSGLLYVIVKTRCFGFLRISKAEFILTNLKTFGPSYFIIIKNKIL